MYNEQKINRNEFRRTVAVVSYYSNKTSRLLEKMVFGRRNFIEKEPSAGRKNKPYRKYGNPYYMGKANYRYIMLSGAYKPFNFVDDVIKSIFQRHLIAPFFDIIADISLEI